MSLEVVERIDKVFGHLELKLVVDSGKVESKFTVTQDARFIEVVLEGRSYLEAPVIASRICGACSIAHFLASVNALENAMGVELPEDAMILKDAMNKAQIAQNNIVHLFFLALPDYYGLKTLGELLSKKPDLVKIGFKLNSLSLKAVDLLGGRIVNPNTYSVGGFRKDLARDRIEKVVKTLREAEDYAKQVLEKVIELELPELEDPAPNYVVVQSPQGYLNTSNNLYGSDGEVFLGIDYTKYIEEKIVEYSNSKAYYYKGKVFYVGSRARLNAYHERLLGYEDYISKILKESNNPFSNIKAKALEILYTIVDVRERLEEFLDKKPKLRTEFKVRAGEGVGVLEAPRGLLIHHYKVDNEGKITYANIITPTAFNSRHIEVSATKLGERVLEANGVDVGELQRKASMLIRAYDPCLPCAVHVTVLKSER